MASQPGRERDYADATSRRAAEIQTAMVSIRRLGHETEFFRRSLRHGTQESYWSTSSPR